MKGLVVSIVVLASSTAWAFHTPGTFDAAAADGGGHRRYFTGSPRQKGYDCTACHVDAAHQIAARVELAPPVQGAYVAGQLYTITVELVGEHRGFGARNNQNGFVAEVVDDRGQPAGRYAVSEDALETIDDGYVVAGEQLDATAWSFRWEAPAAGRGPVTLHLGLVDGDGAGEPATPLTDPGGDDVAVIALRLCEGSSGCPDRPVAAAPESRVAGCNSAGSGAWWFVLALLAGIRSRRRGGLAGLALIGALVGCWDPTVPGECPGRVCGGAATADAGSSCRESWSCTSWEAPAGSDQATRTCTDNNDLGTTECKPAVTATLPALDLEMYKCRVHPIFQKGCGMLACHGNADHPFRTYTRGRWRNDEIVNRVSSCLATGTVDLQQAATGTVMCEGWLPHTAQEWKKSFDSARSFMLDVADPAESLLLREATVGGLPHANVKLFETTDADYATIEAWLGGAQLGTTCDTGKN